MSSIHLRYKYIYLPQVMNFFRPYISIILKLGFHIFLTSQLEEKQYTATKQVVISIKLNEK